MRDLKIHTFLLLLATLLPAVSHAYDFKQGNLYYKILSEEELTVATAENNDIRNPTYSGDIDIPSYVTHDGKRYTVTEIGGFANSPNVTSVTIPETAVKVTHFYGGSTGSQGSGWMIKAVTGPGGNGGQTNDGVSSLKEIRFNAINCTWCGFYSPGMPGLDRITSWSYPFPPSVERIVIGSKVTRLPEYAFYLCTKVKTLTIPASVTEIGRNIIKTDSTDPVCQLSALDIYSSDLNCQWTLKDPSIINWKITTFTAGMATLLGNPKDLVIPEGFTSVKKETFVGSKLESVNFPSTITEIEERAFAGSEIQSMTFTEPSQLKKIAKSAFSLCYNLQSIELPNPLTEIGEYAFASCKNLKNITIPNSVNKIGKYTFSRCGNLYSIDIPKSLKVITESSFADTSIEKILIPNTVEIIEYGAFSDNLSELIISDGNTPLVISSNVVDEHFIYHIGTPDHVYMGRDIINDEDPSFKLTKPFYSTTSIEIGKNVTEIKDKSFAWKSNLKSIILPTTLKTIGNEAFCGCIGLESIELPTSLTTIGSHAFYECENLSSIKLPETLTSIGEYSFSGCMNITSLDLPKNLKTIGKGAFAGCGFTQITLPESLTKIDDWVFNCCPITTIEIPKTITEIGEYAFYNSYLTHVTIPNTVNIVGVNAFGECRNLSEFIIEDGDTHISVPTYELTSEIDNVYIGRKTINKDGDFVNPFKGKSIEIGCKMDILPTNTFRQDPNLVSIALPDGMKSIEEGAFTGCPNLTTVKLPETLSNIDNWAFSECTELTSINLPASLTSIGEGAFSGCTKLSSINLPESIISIGNYAFSECENLESIILPEAMSGISWRTFYNCTSLKSISLPNSVTKIGQEAFRNCKMLETIKIPNSVNTIENWAFADCENLNSLELDGYSIIYFAAFSGCPNINKVRVESATPPAYRLINEDGEYDYSLFDSHIYETAILSVPEGAIDKYKNAILWDRFFNIKESGIEDVIADGDAEAEVTARQYYGIDGRVLGDKLPTVPGHYIERLRYADGKVTTNKIAVQ